MIQCGSVWSKWSMTTMAGIGSGLELGSSTPTVTSESLKLKH